MFRTKKEIQQKVTPCGRTFTIPAMTPVHPAVCLPQGGYFAEEWMQILDADTQCTLENIGFHFTDEEVEEVEDAELTYLGNFDLTEEKSDTPLLAHDYHIRAMTEEEADEAISKGQFNSYIVPSEFDGEVDTYETLSEKAADHHGLDSNEWMETLPHESSPDSVDDGTWINVRLFIPASYSTPYNPFGSD